MVTRLLFFIRFSWSSLRYDAPLVTGRLLFEFWLHNAKCHTKPYQSSVPRNRQNIINVTQGNSYNARNSWNSCNKQINATNVTCLSEPTSQDVLDVLLKFMCVFVIFWLHWPCRVEKQGMDRLPTENVPPIPSHPLPYLLHFQFFPFLLGPMVHQFH